MNILDNFRLSEEKEDFERVHDTIDKGIYFKGTNLWILVFAIFIASLGLNINSPAVIIGAMLVSPLMGPIIGMGYSMGINDLGLLKKAFYSYLYAALVGLTTSTIFFLISPIDEAHSEILARTSPNIYDVLIALFGGLAGILATSSKLKGNVIPGVAIATALMPPLCTAGFGLATFQFQFFFGAFYLFLINSVFIALATLITIRFLKFPYKHLPEPKDELKAQRIVWLITLATLLPSLYFGYDIVRQNKFEKQANRFIENEAVFPNDYLLKKTIDARQKTITLTYGGEFIEENRIMTLKSRMKNYDLENAHLTVRQGFAYLKEDKSVEVAKVAEETNKLTRLLNQKDKQIQFLQSRLDSVVSQNRLSNQIYLELKNQYPEIQSFILQPAVNNGLVSRKEILIAALNCKRKMKPGEKQKIESWLKIRTKVNNLKLYIEP